jgi:hypothetical protein
MLLQSPNEFFWCTFNLFVPVYPFSFSETNNADFCFSNPIFLISNKKDDNQLDNIDNNINKFSNYFFQYFCIQTRQSFQLGKSRLTRIKRSFNFALSQETFKKKGRKIEVIHGIIKIKEYDFSKIFDT